MGTYATHTSISIRLPDIMDANTTTSDAKFKNTFSNYINQGESEFNSVAAKRYGLPFTTVPPLARTISFDIAAYYTIRAFSSRDWPNRNAMLEDFGKAFDTLKMIEEGKMKLALTDGSLIGPLSTFAQTNRTNEDPVFDLDDPTQWAVDQNRIDDMSNSRQ